MPAAPDRDQNLILAGEANACNDIVRASAPRDERWALVHHAVPHLAGIVIPAVGGSQDAATKATDELGDGRWRQTVLPADYRRKLQIIHCVASSPVGDQLTCQSGAGPMIGSRPCHDRLITGRIIRRRTAVRQTPISHLSDELDSATIRS